jgi:hypothetical protein
MGCFLRAPACKKQPMYSLIPEFPIEPGNWLGILKKLLATELLVAKKEATQMVFSLPAQPP